MTTRRHRKSGSGPSATALIAWVNGGQSMAGAAVSGAHAWSSGRAPSGRALLVGRACGLAAGTLRACGSVLAGAVQVGDGSLGDRVLLPSYTPAGPATASGSGGYGEPAAADAESAAPAPDAVHPQSLAGTGGAGHPRYGLVHRNKPVSVTAAAQPGSPAPTAQQSWSSPPSAGRPAATDPIEPMRPVLRPAASGLSQIGEVLAPGSPRDQQAISS